MSRRGEVVQGPWETPGQEPRRWEGGQEAAQRSQEPAREMPKRQPGETGLAFVRRLAQEWHGLEVPPEDPPPPPSGKLRVPRKVRPFEERIEEIYRGIREREPGEEG